jgi:hypothetical protein
LQEAISETLPDVTLKTPILKLPNAIVIIGLEELNGPKKAAIEESEVHDENPTFSLPSSLYTEA